MSSFCRMLVNVMHSVTDSKTNLRIELIPTKMFLGRFVWTVLLKLSYYFNQSAVIYYML
jgi:hypothetical protein